MDKPKIAFLALLFGFAGGFALQGGYFIPGGIAFLINGVLVIYAHGTTKGKIAGALIALFGAFVICAALGAFLASITQRQIAYLGGALLAIGVHTVRHAPRRRKLGALLIALGLILLAYAFGIIG